MERQFYNSEEQHKSIHEMQTKNNTKLIEYNLMNPARRNPFNNWNFIFYCKCIGMFTLQELRGNFAGPWPSVSFFCCRNLKSHLQENVCALTVSLLLGGG